MIFFNFVFIRNHSKSKQSYNPTHNLDLLLTLCFDNGMEVEGNSKLPLPDAFIEFLSENGIDPSIYTASRSTPRYIRLKPGCELDEIEAEISCKLEKVAWLPAFYSLASHINIANSRAYQLGKIYGVDAASGAAVSALDIKLGDHVLDLCAAPDLLRSSGSVTGVDVATHRLAACRTMLQKYGLGDRCRLFVADGTSFSLIPAGVHSNSQSCESSSEEKLEVYKEWTSRRPWKERKRAIKTRESGGLQLGSLVQDPELIFYGKHSGVIGLTKSELYQTVPMNVILNFGYDKVLVDAECTHDGSIRHIEKFEKWGWTTLQSRVLDADRTDDLTNLQEYVEEWQLMEGRWLRLLVHISTHYCSREDRGSSPRVTWILRGSTLFQKEKKLQLLANGFRLMKVGGFLVYSTCSLTVAQNEDVVEQFLLRNASAELLEVDAAKNWPCNSGKIPKTLRFDPLSSQTSGLFVAKFTKLAT